MTFNVKVLEVIGGPAEIQAALDEAIDGLSPTPLDGAPLGVSITSNMNVSRILLSYESA